MIRLLLADVLPLDDPALYDALYAGASASRRAAAEAYRFRKDRNLSIGAAALLDRGLAAFGLRERDMSYGRTADGKPFFRNAPDIHFSISHSSSKVAVALSDREVGCDIERMDDIDMAVGERFFSREEYLSAMASEDCLRAFYRCWTLKESYLKAVGKGLALPPESFTVDPVSGTVKFAEGSDDRFAFLSPSSFDGYECALCYSPSCGLPEICFQTLYQI